MYLAYPKLSIQSYMSGMGHETTSYLIFLTVLDAEPGLAVFIWHQLSYRGPRRPCWFDDALFQHLVDAFLQNFSGSIYLPKRYL